MSSKQEKLNNLLHQQLFYWNYYFNNNDEYDSTQRNILMDNILFLLELGADINSKNKYGETILMHCITFDFDLNFIEKLISLGANINTKNIDNETVLTYALRDYYYCTDLQLVRKLIELGADTSKLNNCYKKKLNEVLSQND